MVKLLACAGALLFASLANAAAVAFYGGVEDTAGTTYEGVGDYNDMIFRLTGPGLTLVSADGQWFNMVNPNEDGSPYWDDKSLDGPQMNVGYCLLDIPNCTQIGSPATPNLQYLARPDGTSMPLDYIFTYNATAGMSQSALLLEIAANASVNELGWYDPTSAATGLIFAGPHTTPFIASFSPTPTFGLWASNGTQTFYSQTVKGADPAQQHIAIFSVGTQDVVVPEPVTFLVVGAGLLAVGLLRRR